MPDRPIRHIIENQKLVSATASMCVSEAALLMKKNKVGAVLVVEGSLLTGIFTERDAVFRVLAEGRDPQKTALHDVMTSTPQTVGPDKPFGYALHLMYEGGFRHVPVVEDGQLVGVVSARDALSSELAQFESDVKEREHIAEILG